MNKVTRALRDNRGSASVEFSLLAIPLFLPLFIFFNAYAHDSDTQEVLRSLAREAVRGYVMSRDDSTGALVAQQIVAEGSKALGFNSSSGTSSPDTSAIEISLQCSKSPCISPDSRVVLTLTTKSQSHQKVSVSAIEYVSPWA